jgi:tetratricopeptide (TPR) repeat protein
VGHDEHEEVVLRIQSDEETAMRSYDEQLALWRGIGDKREIANALYNRSYADMIRIMGGELDLVEKSTGRAMLDEALALYQELGDKSGEGNILWGLGSLYYFGADAAESEGWYRRSLELHRQGGNRTMEAWSLHMLASSQNAQRQFAVADETGRHALRHFHEAGDVSGVILVLDDLSVSAVGRGEADRAGKLWGAARHLQNSTGTALADYVEQIGTLFGIPTPKDALPEDRLAELSAAGAAMSFDEIVAYALGGPDGVPPGPHVEVA